MQNDVGTDGKSGERRVESGSRPVRVLCNEGSRDEFVIAANSREEANEIIGQRASQIRTMKFFTLKRPAPQF